MKKPKISGSFPQKYFPHRQSRTEDGGEVGKYPEDDLWSARHSESGSMCLSLALGPEYKRVHEGLGLVVPIWPYSQRSVMVGSIPHLSLLLCYTRVPGLQHWGNNICDL